MKVIIADDERIVRIGLKTMIKWEERGYELAGMAEDGVAALAMVESLRPDIIITDLKMPKMDGLQLLQRLADMNYKGKVIVLSSYDEFELVKEAMKLGAMDYLLKITLKTDDLLQVLDKASSELDKAFESQVEQVKLRSAYRQQKDLQKNTWLRDFLTGQIDFEKVDTGGFERFGLPEDGQPYFCLLLMRRGGESSGKITDKGLYSFSVRNIASEMLAEWPETEVVEVEHGIFMVIVPVSDSGITKERKLQAASTVGRTLEMYLNEKLIVVISPHLQGWAALSNVYHTCREAAETVFYIESGESPKLIDAESSFLTGEWSSTHHYKLLAEAQKSLSQMDVLAVEELFQQVCREAKEMGIRPMELKSFAAALIDLLLVKGAEEGAGSEELAVTLRRKLENSRTLSALLDNFNEAVDMTKEHIPSSQRVWRSEIRLAAEFMKEHAHEKITLSRIAQEVNLNESYLSRLFKQETGRNIVHFLNELRMERAAELMRDPHLKMKEIAGKVGIDDPFYFNRLFKKHYGISPTEYKNRLLNFSK